MKAFGIQRSNKSQPTAVTAAVAIHAASRRWLSFLDHRRLIMKTNEKQIWFPAKKYGWGWGLPCSWQGWVVLMAYPVLLTAGWLLIGMQHYGLVIAYGVALAIALFIICLLKGEKPRWRWGKD